MILPAGIIARCLGKDILKLKIDKSAKSYWIKRNKSFGPMKKQF